MIALSVEAPFASFRTSYARAYAETYRLPPPSTIYGMLLSLVGERSRRSHLGSRLAIGISRKPRLSTVLKKLSRYKYGVPSKQSSLGNAPDYVEVVCGIDCLIYLDSNLEAAAPTLEQRVEAALDRPDRIDRTGVLCLGLSDDMVDVSRAGPRGADSIEWLSLDERGAIELPVWVDHVGSADTRWRRFRLEQGRRDEPPPSCWISISPPENL